MTERDAKTLYQELIVDHGNAPRNHGPLPGATHEATAKNPLCGDRVTVRLRVDDAGVVREARFEARGCMIAKASGSLLTEAVLGATAEGARALGRTVAELVDGTGDADAAAGAPSASGALRALEGVRAFPARKGCVTLAWRALDAALARQ